MAKKRFNDLLEERRAKDRKTDGTESAKDFLSSKTKGEHKDGYKETTIKLRITEEEKALWQQKAKEQNNKPLSAFIRDNVNYNIERQIVADRMFKK